MKKDFSVAGHNFRVILPSACPLWAHMQQYDPFFVENAEPVFQLSLEKEIDVEGRTLYYDQSAEPGETKITIYRKASDWIFESSPTPLRPVAMRLLLCEDFSRSKLQILNPAESLFALNNALMLQYAFRTAGMRTLEMHASVIAYDGRAYLFLAKSGTGKSTHSRMWLENIEGSHLLNDDNPIVRVLDDGQVRVYGSPWSGKTPCYVNENYPVGAMVQIKRAKEDRAVRLDVVHSYALVYSSSSGIKFESSMGDALSDTIEKVVSSTRCFTLECLPDAQAAFTCREAVCR